MVGIVIVSHSATLAQGVRELVEQMVQGQIPLAIAGGIDDPENPFGTDVMKTVEAIESVYSDDGVVVLMDLGSAVMSAEAALEFLEPEHQARVHLLPAPLIEGVMAAAVQASVGASVEQVMAEAQGALQAKADLLSAEVPIAGVVVAPPQPSLPTADAESIRLIVPNRLGLHARPAARFVRTASQFKAAISVSKGGKTANAKSINQVATLGAKQGDEIVIRASGPDARQALQAVQTLAENDFGDRDELGANTVPPVPVAADEGQLVGIGASPGVAVGPVVQYRPRLPQVEVRQDADPDAEWARLEQAIAAAREDIQDIHRRAVERAGAAEADIFEAHLLFLDDPALREAVETRLRASRMNAEAAWQQAIEEMAATYRAMDSAYMQARAADVIDVGQRVLGHLMQAEPPSLEFNEPSILIAADLTPSDTARLEPDRVLGICTERGGYTSHSAILARALGIPAVVGLGPTIGDTEQGQIVGLDGSTGQIWLAPESKLIAELQTRHEAWQAERLQSRLTAAQPAITRDGHRIEIAANIGGLNDITIALQSGAEGVGLFRSEFLFLDRATAPTEDEQTAVYRQVAVEMGDAPVIIRTLDVGGDKPLPYFDLGHEDNPFLGWRGIRFTLESPEIFKPQLRAILRASAGHNIRLMFPMVSTLAEVEAGKAMLAEAQADLRQAGIPFDEDIEVGIMVEVPAAAVVGDQLARAVDFFSIGTNDLAQYVMAADRGNARVAALADAFQPALLRSVASIVEAAHTAGIWVGMCGELAGDARAAPVLVGLGLDELSMNGPSIPSVKTAIRQLTLEQARHIAAQVLDMESAAAIKAFLQNL